MGMILGYNATCNSTLDELRDVAEVAIAGTWTFHALGLIIAPACALIAVLLSFYLIFMHATHYTKPYEQRHIIRILFMIPVYATSAYLSFRFHWHAIYFQVISDCYEAFAIASFFALLCHYIAPSLHEQKHYFRTIQPKGWVWPVSWMRKCCCGDRGPWRTPRSGLTWFNIVWLGVYQYCFIRVAMTITSVVTQYFGRYCESSNSPLFSHIWTLVINAAAVTVAMFCLIQFYVQLRVDLSQHSPFLKVLAIKLVIFLSFWQTFMISILTSATFNVLKPTATLAYPDLKVGIPSLLLCIEMAIFAFLHLFAFPWQPYRLDAAPTNYPRLSSVSGESAKNIHGEKQGGFLGWKAFVDAMNPWDLVKAFARSMRWLFVGRRSRETDTSYMRNIAEDNDMVLQTNTEGYKQNVNLPIADEFRRSRFGMPTTSDGLRTPGPGEEGAGLIAHAQANPRNSSTGYVPAKERYDINGHEIGPSRYEKVRHADPSPERMEGAIALPPMRYQTYSQEQNIGMAMGEPHPYEGQYAQQYPPPTVATPYEGQYVQQYPPPTATELYVEQKRQDRRQVYNPSEQWANSSQPRDRDPRDQPNQF